MPPANSERSIQIALSLTLLSSVSQLCSFQVLDQPEKWLATAYE